MPYLMDRQRAVRWADVVAVVATRQRRIRSRLILRDNSLYPTLTRPTTLLRYAQAPTEGLQGFMRQSRKGTRRRHL